MGREDFAAETERHRRPYLGRGLFAGGIVALLLAVVFAGSASIAGMLGLGTAGARELAGALAGIGLAAALVGALAVVPTDRAGWSRGIAGTLLAVGGVGAFLFAYPGRWYGDGADLTLAVVAVYSLGVVTTASYLFSAVTDLARRVGRAEALAAAVPGDATDVSETEGTSESRTTDTTAASTDQGEVLYERAADPEPMGTTAADTTETPAERPTIDRIEPLDGGSWPDSGFTLEPIDRPQAASGTPADVWGSSDSGTEARSRDDSRSNQRGSNASDTNGNRTPIAAGHNGARTRTSSTVAERSPGDDSLASLKSTRSSDTPEPADEGVTSTRSPTERTEPAADGGVDTIQFGSSVDRYCGNCAHFRYVQADDGLSPYCGYHDEVMNDMESCLEWTSNA